MCNKTPYMTNWTNWKSMPTPQSCRNIEGPKGAGLYQIRNIKTNELVLFGIGKKCQSRMRSLFPEPFGTSGRSNYSKRNYILENWQNLEYRTMETENRTSAETVEKLLKNENNHIFNT